MRKLLNLFLTVCLCLSLAGCDFFTWKKYRNPEYKFSLMLLRSWEIDEEAKDAALVVFMPSDDPQVRFKSNMRVVVQDLPAEIPLSTYYDINREELLSVFPKHGNIVEDQGMTGIVRYQRISFDAKIAEGLLVRAINTVWIKGKRVYLLTSVMDLKEADKLQSLYNKVCSSLRF